ncbi:hypothetical protein D3C85_1530050 [compost metagenome]
MRREGCACIIDQEYRLKWNLNLNILRHIQEYPAVPQSRMKSGQLILFSWYSSEQMFLNHVSMLTYSGLQICKDNALSCKFW